MLSGKDNGEYVMYQTGATEGEELAASRYILLPGTNTLRRKDSAGPMMIIYTTRKNNPCSPRIIQGTAGGN